MANDRKKKGLIVDMQKEENLYKNEITLPLHTLLSDTDVEYICEHFIKIIDKHKNMLMTV